MTTFTIEPDNNVTAHATRKEAKAVPNTERFSSADELAKLTENWPTARLIEIWNGIPAMTPVKKFTDRKAATTRIWKAIQSLGESISAETGTEAEASTDEATKPSAAIDPARETAQAKPDVVEDLEQPASGSDDVQPEPIANEV